MNIVGWIEIPNYIIEGIFNVFVGPLQISKSQKGNHKINIPDMLPCNYFLNSIEA